MVLVVVSTLLFWLRTRELVYSEMFQRLFTKFASKSFEDTCLSLFISRKIIGAHGGEIRVKNDENAKGDTSGFSLPLI